MVCVPCIVIPLFLWVFHRFIQPWLYPILPERVKSWFNFNMRIHGVTPPKGEAENSTNDADGDVGQDGSKQEESTTRNGCPFKPSSTPVVTAGGGDKKTD